MHYPILLEIDLAKRWKFSVMALRNWRYRNVGPRWHKLLGRHVRYHVADILEFERTALPQWLAQQAVEEQLVRTGKPGKFAVLDASDPSPDFVDAKTAAATSRLPYYFFADPLRRNKLQIPHMAIVGVLRFSLLAVWHWELQRSQVGGKVEPVIESPPLKPESPAGKALRWYEITPAKTQVQADANPPTSPQHHSEPPSNSQELTQNLHRSLILEPSVSTFKRPRPTQTGKAREMTGLTLSTMTEQELGSRWQVSVKTLRRWRELHIGPKFIKLDNRAVRYRLTDVEAYERRTR